MIAHLQSPQEAASWLRAQVTGSLYADSRCVQSGDGFLAWPGAARDARHHVGAALQAGANACLVERHGVEKYLFTSERIATYGDLKVAAAPIAAAYFGEPSGQLQTVAVTGTNGKTSTAWWLAHALNKLNMTCGMVGTLGIGAPDALVPNGLTTPDPVLLQQQLRRFVDRGFSACAIEASSIGIAEHRLDGTHFDVAVFTNFTQDHLDYHGSMQSYWAAKQSLFNWPGLRAAVINVDDPHGQALSKQLAGGGIDVWTVAIDHSARLQAQAIDQTAMGSTFFVVEGAEQRELTLGALGQYNISNMLGVIGVLRALGVSLKNAANACCSLPAVPGRLNTLGGQGAPLVAIDYAHTPDAIQKALLALRPVAHSRGGQLWCVLGCGGDRDPAKRPLMAAMARAHADRVVITSDNPRSEEPAEIIRQMLLGVSSQRVQVQPDRALAIAETVASAAPEDVILLAGKGQENYQDISGVKRPFDDTRHAQAALGLRLPAGAAG